MSTAARQRATRAGQRAMPPALGNIKEERLLVMQPGVTVIANKTGDPRQSAVDIDGAQDSKTVFAAPLRGVALAEDIGLTLFDPILWEKILALPLSISREKPIGLILDGIPPTMDIPVPALAVGLDASPGLSAQRLKMAFRPAAVPTRSNANGGVPVCEYPYQISRRGMLLLAPWGLFFVAIILALLFMAFAFNKLPLQLVSFGRMIACAMLGFFDMFFLYISIKMLLAKPSPIVVTTSGIMLPVILPSLSSHNVFVAFDEMDGMLEYWHYDTVQMLKLKTGRGVFHLNMFLMQAPHFEELHRLLRRRIHEKSDAFAAANRAAIRAASRAP